jgi:hypothetical protein
MNNKLVKSIIGIQNRKPHYPDILDRHINGQNVYMLVGHSRGITHTHQGMSEVKHVGMTERSGTVLKTIPCSNLNQRKKHVLKVHAENLKLVQRL